MRCCLKSITQYSIGLSQRSYRTIKRPISELRDEKKTGGGRFTKQDDEKKYGKRLTGGERFTKQDDENKYGKSLTGGGRFTKQDDENKYGKSITGGGRFTKQDDENKYGKSLTGGGRFTKQDDENKYGKSITGGERFTKQDDDYRTKLSARSLQQYETDSEPALAGYQCPGCGSKYQYTIPDKPGYVPYPILMSWSVEEEYSKDQEYIYCSRCIEINTSQEVQKYSVTEKKFDSIITAMIKQRATAIIVCDITTFPMSLPPLSLIPRDLPIILCLNKCDLLARDSEEFEKLIIYYKNVVDQTIGLKLKIEHVQLTSGIKGTGLKKLKHLILRYLFYNKDRLSSSLYLLGSANAGKSTIFNKLVPLLSGDLQGQSTVSQWPGTTVNNLSLRVPYPRRAEDKGKETLGEVDENVRQQSFVELEDENVRQQSFVELEDENGREQSFVESEDENVRQQSFVELEEDEEGDVRKWFHHHIMDQITKERGKHLVDTPGVLPTWDLANYLTQQGLQALHPKHMLVQRVIKLAPGESLYITSMARIDFIAGSGYESLTLILHTPTSLPIRKGKFEEVVSEGLDIGVEGELPSLQNKLYFVHNYPAWTEPSGDIHLGALGWCSVKLLPEGTATLVVSAVNLNDINYRTPSLLLVPQRNQRPWKDGRKDTVTSQGVKS